jgi:hypothetical protein
VKGHNPGPPPLVEQAKIPPDSGMALSKTKHAPTIPLPASRAGSLLSKGQVFHLIRAMEPAPAPDAMGR